MEGFLVREVGKTWSLSDKKRTSEGERESEPQKQSCPVELVVSFVREAHKTENSTRLPTHRTRKLFSGARAAQGGAPAARGLNTRPRAAETRPRPWAVHKKLLRSA